VALQFIAQVVAPTNETGRILWQIGMPFMLLCAGLGIVAVILRLLLDRLFTDRRGRLPALPEVHLNKKFITYAEAGFYRVLYQVVGDRGIILAQVALNRLLYFPGNNQTNPGKQMWRNKTGQKSVDFVIVDPKTLRPLVIIELNDPSHEREDRVVRDEEVAAILNAAGIPLEQIQCARQYDSRALMALLQPYFLPLDASRRR